MPNNDQLPVQTDTQALCSTSPSALVSTLPKERQIALMTSLFLSFGSTWGPKWTDHIAGLDICVLAADWADALGDLTQDQIRTKLKICRKTLFWPPCPAEIIWAGEPKRPRSRAGWLAWGKTSGNDAVAGETWDDYLARLEATWDANGGAPA
jgi:hypothetical protein